MIFFVVWTPLSNKFCVRPTLKNCWFAVLLPTHKNWPYPKNFMAMLGKIFFFFKLKNLKSKIQFLVNILKIKTSKFN